MDDDHPIIQTDVQLLRGMYRTIRSEANNLNQIARSLNSGHRSNQLNADLSSTLEAIKLSSEQLSQVLSHILNHI